MTLTVKKGYKYRLYPTAEQALYLNLVTNYRGIHGKLSLSDMTCAVRHSGQEEDIVRCL